jgi:hypothetical protein
MSRSIDWIYVGTEGSPEAIRLNGATIHKGTIFAVPEDYDWTREYGSDVRHTLKIERVSPPQDALVPLVHISDALTEWQKETEKSKRRFRRLRAPE